MHLRLLQPTDAEHQGKFMLAHLRLCLGVVVTVASNRPEILIEGLGICNVFLKVVTHGTCECLSSFDSYILSIHVNTVGN